MPVDILAILDEDRGALDSCSDNGDERGGQDTEEGYESPERQLAPFSRVRNLPVSVGPSHKQEV